MDLNIFKAGSMPREQLRMPQESYVQIDHWIDYLSPEQYYWWRKFISWVDRSPSRNYEFHVPYTLESVYEKLGVSKSHFYKKIKILWECGLIELVEFDRSLRKTTKPRNIIVYNYPFNKPEYEYLPLEKRRDWTENYESESKIHGYKGALISKGLQMETVVDKGESKGLQMETVEGLQMETVRVSKQRPINYLNKSLISLNNSINNSNNSLSKTEIELVKELLRAFEFSEGERDQVVELLINRNISGFTKQDIINQGRSMALKTNIRLRAVYFVNGLEANIGRTYQTPKPKTEDTHIKQVPFYNWLEQ
jgi:hypothetical protein